MDELSQEDLDFATYLATLDDWVYEEPHNAIENVNVIQAGGNGDKDDDIRLLDVSEYVTIESKGYRNAPTYGLHFRCYSVKVTDLERVPFNEIPATIALLLDHILASVLSDVGAREMVRVVVNSQALNYPIYTPPIEKSQLTVRRWMTEIERVLQSHEDFLLDETFEVFVQYTETLRGSCRRLVPQLLRRRLMRMRSVVIVKNMDSICLAHALVVGKACADKDRLLQRRLQRGKKLQTREAEKLVRLAGLTHREFTVGDVPKFETVLEGYQIIIVSLEHGNRIVYSGTVKAKHIVLLHHNRHFDVLTSLPAFFKKSYWCYRCNKGYDHRMNHRCVEKCSQCLRSQCEKDQNKLVYCNECNRSFFGIGCFAAHKETTSTKRQKIKKKSLCSMVYVCRQCERIVSLRNRRKNNAHTCGEVFCKPCGVHVCPDTHQCYMRPHVLSSEELERNAEARFLYFDFETYISADCLLIPNLAVVQNDQGQQWTFPNSEQPLGEDVTNDLCTFLFDEQHRGYIVIAHNFKAFDGYFILNWLLKNGITPKVIMNGGKLLQLDVPQYNIRFRDSINYNPQSLAKWPATFGLPDLSKGCFPHKFNQKQNWDKVLPFPKLHDYGYNAMQRSAKKSFKIWYDEEVHRKNNIFDFRKEFVTYCQNDVTVLRLCCQQFRALFQEISGGLCPFVSALTIAGLCNLYWRVSMLKPDYIGLVPMQRFARNRLQSVKAMQWLKWMEEKYSCVIQSMVRGKEHKIGPYFVDGFCVEQNRVYEFYGCWYHGCPICMDAETVHPFRNMSMADIYRETLKREQYLRSEGHLITVIWEHEYEEQLRENHIFKGFVQQLTVHPPLNPRDAFYGGRTNAVKLLHEVKDDEQIMYFDVCSEYPFVNKNKRYPVGFPAIITSDFKQVSQYLGLICCEILPPKTLYLPVLPYRSNGKLTFPLCATCVRQQQQTICTHRDQERALTGTWCTPEIHKAVEYGYEVTKVYEVWHYHQYDDHLFRDYIDKFLKIKTEASGWPAGIETEEQKQQYIKDFIEKEGIQLDYHKIRLNPGLRALAKLCLNSFWGRLGMQENKLNTMYVSEPKQFHEMLFSGKYHVHSWDLFSDEMLQLTYTKEDGFVDQNPNTNVVLAAFTTCWARLHLYKFMDMVKERLLYFDTDSIFFVSRPGATNPPTGTFLGDLTNELRPGQFIVQFVSLGAKTYAYVTNDGQCVAKVKGFTINGQTQELINFGSMLHMLHNKTKLIVQYNDVIQRVKSSVVLRNAVLQKQLQITYDKRVVNSDWTTLPYGYNAG